MRAKTPYTCADQFANWRLYPLVSWSGILLGLREIALVGDKARGMTKKVKSRKRQPLPKPATITMPPATFQPRKADMDKEYDMPGASVEQIRRAFFRPVKVLREETA